MHFKFTMNGNCNLCYTVHTCNINVIINDFLLGIKFVISRFHCTTVTKLLQCMASFPPEDMRALP